MIPHIRPHTCKNCAFVNSDDGIRALCCRRNPPNLVMHMTPKGPVAGSQFVPVLADWYCGEWKPAVAGVDGNPIKTIEV